MTNPMTRARAVAGTLLVALTIVAGLAWPAPTGAATSSVQAQAGQTIATQAQVSRCEQRAATIMRRQLHWRTVPGFPIDGAAGRYYDTTVSPAVQAYYFSHDNAVLTPGSGTRIRISCYELIDRRTGVSRNHCLTLHWLRPATRHERLSAAEYVRCLRFPLYVIVNSHPNH